MPAWSLRDRVPPDRSCECARYYVADGSYAARTWTTATSGSQIITLVKATAADHGTETGWVSTFGDGVATWACSQTFNTSFWTFSGNRSVLWSTTPTDYGFNVAQCASPMSTATGVTDIVLSDLAASAPTTDTEKEFIQGRGSRVTITRSFLDAFQGCMMTRGAGDKDAWTLTYTRTRNMWSSSANHGECINANESNLTNAVVSYNLFEGHSTEWSTATIVANNSDINGILVCGNVFHDATGTNGLITGSSQGTMNNAHVYNNTFYIFTAGFDLWLGDSQTTPTGNTARNNLLMSMSRSFAGNWNVDYSLYVSTTGSGTQTNSIVTTTNPFVNIAGGSYALAGPTVAGQTQTQCTTDALGKTRGSDGTWDRGALEYP